MFGAKLPNPLGDTGTVLAKTISFTRKNEQVISSLLGLDERSDRPLGVGRMHLVVTSACTSIYWLMSLVGRSGLRTVICPPFLLWSRVHLGGHWIFLHPVKIKLLAHLAILTPHAICGLEWECLSRFQSEAIEGDRSFF